MNAFHADGSPIHEPATESPWCPVHHNQWLDKEGKCPICELTPQESAQSAQQDRYDRQRKERD